MYWPQYDLERAQQQARWLPDELKAEALKRLKEIQPGSVPPPTLSPEEKMFACMIWLCGMKQRAAERVMGFPAHNGNGVRRTIDRVFKESLPAVKEGIMALPAEWKARAMKRFNVAVAKLPLWDQELRVISDCVKLIGKLPQAAQERVSAFIFSKYGTK